MKLFKTMLAALAASVVLSAAAVGLEDLMNPDDVMLRRPSRSARAVVTVTNVVTETDHVTHTNFVTQTDRITLTNVVTETDHVTLTNVVTQTDVVVRTNVVTQTDRVTLTNVVTQTDVVLQTNYVTRTDVVLQTNLVTQVDWVVKTNVVVEKRFDESEKKALEAKLAAALEAKAAAERRARYLASPDPDERVDAPKPMVLVEKEAAAVAKRKWTPKKPSRKAPTGREAKITADRMDFDRREGVILFDRHVSVDDEQYQMHADRLFVFLDTNSVAKAGAKAGHGKKKDADAGALGGVGGGKMQLKRLVAIGHVSITNDVRSAYCARATYSKPTGKIVMYGDEETRPWLLDESQSPTPQSGERITFWLDSEIVEVEKPSLSGPAVGGGSGALKKLR